MENNIYPKNLSIKLGYSSIVFATSDIKENLSQLNQKTIIEKMNYGITNFTLKVLELGEDIANIKLNSVTSTVEYDSDF